MARQEDAKSCLCQVRCHIDRAQMGQLGHRVPRYHVGCRAASWNHEDDPANPLPQINAVPAVA